jgi:hypothetical protein
VRQVFGDSVEKLAARCIRPARKKVDLSDRPTSRSRASVRGKATPENLLESAVAEFFNTIRPYRPFASYRWGHAANVMARQADGEAAFAENTMFNRLVMRGVVFSHGHRVLRLVSLAASSAISRSSAARTAKPTAHVVSAAGSLERRPRQISVPGAAGPAVRTRPAVLRVARRRSRSP